MTAVEWTGRPMTDYAQRRYHTYPHSNGFADGGESLVVGQFEPQHVSLWKLNLQTGDESFVWRFSVTSAAQGLSRQPLWFDIASGTNTMAVIAEGAFWLLDLSRPGEGRVLVRESGGVIFHPMPSISADGSKVITYFDEGPGRAAAIINTGDGSSKRLFAHNWAVNHVHFSPFDPQWIGYCHEGRCDQVRDRVWGWHPQHAPQGRCLFDQALPATGESLQVGHEANCFHNASTLVVAFGAGPRPSGLYEVFFDGRPPRLVSPGDRDWHCISSRCGQWAVVDTTGPHDAPGRGWENNQQNSDIVLVNLHTGQRTFLARSHQVSHPWHPHPVFGPDGRSIVYAEALVGSEPLTGRVHLLRRA